MYNSITHLHHYLIHPKTTLTESKVDLITSISLSAISTTKLGMFNSSSMNSSSVLLRCVGYHSPAISASSPPPHTAPRRVYLATSKPVSDTKESHLGSPTPNLVPPKPPLQPSPSPGTCRAKCAWFYVAGVSLIPISRSGFDREPSYFLCSVVLADPG